MYFIDKKLENALGEIRKELLNKEEFLNKVRKIVSTL